MNPIIRLISLPSRKRADRIAGHVLPHVKPGERILDIGSGTGLVAAAIRRHGHDVSLLDVADYSLASDLRPQLFDGRRLPYADDSYDVALLLTVLHHIRQPEDILAEACRVARRIVIIEDVFANPFELWFTRIGDSWLNRQIFTHPYSNRSDPHWRMTFAQLGLRLIESRQDIHWFFPFRFRHAIYLLSRDGSANPAAPRAAA